MHKVNDLAKDEETLLVDGGRYEVWSPYNAERAAAALMEMLEG